MVRGFRGSGFRVDGLTLGSRVIKKKKRRCTAATPLLAHCFILVLTPERCRPSIFVTAALQSGDGAPLAGESPLSSLSSSPSSMSMEDSSLGGNISFWNLTLRFPVTGSSSFLVSGRARGFPRGAFKGRAPASSSSEPSSSELGGQGVVLALLWRFTARTGPAGRRSWELERRSWELARSELRRPLERAEARVGVFTTSATFAQRAAASRLQAVVARWGEEGGIDAGASGGKEAARMVAKVLGVLAPRLWRLGRRLLVAAA